MTDNRLDVSSGGALFDVHPACRKNRPQNLLRQIRAQSRWRKSWHGWLQYSWRPMRRRKLPGKAGVEKRLLPIDQPLLASSHSTKRREHVLGEGNRSGKSFQRALLRNNPQNTLETEPIFGSRPAATRLPLVPRQQLLHPLPLLIRQQPRVRASHRKAPFAG